MHKSLFAALIFLAACTTDPASQPGTVPNPSSSPSASAAPSAAPAASTLTYLGQIADRVSPAFAGGPDGTQDYVFRFTHDFKQEVTLKSLIISRIENGQPLGMAGWATSPGKYWVTHVTANGRELNGTSQTDSLGPISGAVEFVLTGASLDPSLLKAGEVYELMVTYAADGAEQVVKARVTL
jgi:hypothetical protein